MDLGIIRLDGDCPPIGGDRLYELALILERIAEVEVSPDVIWLDVDSLAVGGDSLVEFP